MQKGRIPMNQNANVQMPKNGGVLGRIVSALLKWVITLGVLPALFLNFCVQPSLNFQPKSYEFSTNYKFRSIVMRLYPQMRIRVGNDVLLMAHLNGFFEQETLYFKDGKATAVRAHQEYQEQMFEYMRESIISKVREMYGNDIAEEIARQLNISVTFLGSVRYQTLLGNYVHQYCVFEDDGVLVDVKKNAGIIWTRLYETEFILHDNPSEIVWDEQVEAAITSVAEEIGGFYGIHTEFSEKR